MEFGVFDHMDRSGAALPEFYESRLGLIEAYDRAGFHGYHVAEHHATPLGMASSPSVFLSAVAQRTARLRFGPLVYTLPLYHPLRLIEEICMLDQMSRGRLIFGVGKGISPIENAYYGLDPAQAQSMFDEALQIVLMGLTSKQVTFEGKHYRFRDVPMVLTPAQAPHPPLWYGANAPESAARMARRGFNVMGNAGTAAMIPTVAAFKAAWRDSAAPDAAMPKIGFSRYVVLADSDDAALAIARRAYRAWYASFIHLWRLHGQAPVLASYPEEFDGVAQDGRGVAGTPDTVRKALAGQIAESGINYLVLRFAYGDLTPAESQRSLDLFVRHVMPALREAAPAAAAD